MGIPSYFSHIVKNYGNILFSLKQHRKVGTSFHSLYMDCNSIIYDTYHQMSKTSTTNTFSEAGLIQSVIYKIDEYIRHISPNNVVYIAFDGVAPVAKMKQQRTRRYKSLYMASILPPAHSEPWNTSAITPGTPFMGKLSTDINNAFAGTEEKYGVKRVIVSAADVAGEGEHKMFQYIRENAIGDENIAVYGLDADLIMLAIFHYHLCKNIYVFRETPEFIKSKVITSPVASDNEHMFMDIDGLCNSILSEMGCKHRDRHQIYDYAFMCFLLGNDFLPHFPSLNIRTHGIQVLLDTYRETLGTIADARFISNTTGNIQWSWVSKFIRALAANECELLIQEHERRDKFDSYVWNGGDREKLIHNTPIICREAEKYICPTEEGWQTRYYRQLLEVDSRDTHITKICTNYLEGLEWVFKYYTEGCVHWKWSYQYSYPPLFSDLVACVPNKEKTLIRKTQGHNQNLSAKTQLAYVLPPELHESLIGKDVAAYLQKHYGYLYETHPEFMWTYCRYFWESHLHMRDIPIEILEKWNSMPAFR